MNGGPFLGSELLRDLMPTICACPFTRWLLSRTCRYFREKYHNQQFLDTVQLLSNARKPTTEDDAKLIVKYTLAGEKGVVLGTVAIACDGNVRVGYYVINGNIIGNRIRHILPRLCRTFGCSCGGSNIDTMYLFQWYISDNRITKYIYIYRNEEKGSVFN